MPAALRHREHHRGLCGVDEALGRPRRPHAARHDPATLDHARQRADRRAREAEVEQVRHRDRLGQALLGVAERLDRAVGADAVGAERIVERRRRRVGADADERAGRVECEPFRRPRRPRELDRLAGSRLDQPDARSRDQVAVRTAVGEEGDAAVGQRARMARDEVAGREAPRSSPRPREVQVHQVVEEADAVQPVEHAPEGPRHGLVVRSHAHGRVGLRDREHERAAVGRPGEVDDGPARARHGLRLTAGRVEHVGLREPCPIRDKREPPVDREARRRRPLPVRGQRARTAAVPGHDVEAHDVASVADGPRRERHGLAIGRDGDLAESDLAADDLGPEHRLTVSPRGGSRRRSLRERRARARRDDEPLRLLHDRDPDLGRDAGREPDGGELVVAQVGAGERGAKIVGQAASRRSGAAAGRRSRGAPGGRCGTACHRR